ncbi:DUF952 domain-containing protein [Nocardioides sp. GY 10127]|uniref:DUF952 domain-containing protein n=1 Tax=Nocardioides sp. GY 10127 TaxID=2569762 RepID=UPI0010A84C22|nr:DUF952 domain-containing protein [Nocardioides sp. GY 10127]TIC84057.1 DUF952 domain-containing protein [Nocardioides sp. GY 10127]
MIVHHVASAADWQAAVATGSYGTSTRGSSVVETGFVHAAHPHQVAGVLERYYADAREPLVLLVIDTGLLDCPVREEAATSGGERFPHLYGTVPVGAVLEVRPLPR